MINENNDQHKEIGKMIVNRLLEILETTTTTRY